MYVTYTHKLLIIDVLKAKRLRALHDPKPLPSLYKPVLLRLARRFLPFKESLVHAARTKTLQIDCDIDVADFA